MELDILGLIRRKWELFIDTYSRLVNVCMLTSMHLELAYTTSWYVYLEECDVMKLKLKVLGYYS